MGRRDRESGFALEAEEVGGDCLITKAKTEAPKEILEDIRGERVVC